MHAYIIDIQIGFQNFSYIFLEPQFETEISGTVFLEKQDGRQTEQTYVIVMGLNEITPNENIIPATLSNGVVDEDYIVTNPNINLFVFDFLPNDQFLDFSFSLYPDNLAEGPEGFQVFSESSERPFDPVFTLPSPGVLFPSTFIIISDDDCKFKLQFH